LDNYILKSNNYFISQIRLNSRDKNFSKINRINGLSPFFFVDDFDYINTVVVECQHTENEGELFRDLILFFSEFPQLIEDSRMENMKIFLKTNFNVEKKKIEKFFLQLNDLKEKVFKKDKNLKKNKEKEINCENENLHETFNSLQNIENENEDEENNENEDEVLSNNENNFKKKFKKKPMGSSDIFYFFMSILIFFYEFILQNKQNDIIQIYIIHYNYFKILEKSCFEKYDLNELKYLVKERIRIMLKNNIKIVPKTLLSIHYKYYIKQLGPIKYLTSFMYENHNHIIKLDVNKCSKNPGITALKLNYCFFSYKKNIIIPKIDINNEIEYIKISNHLIRPNFNELYLGFNFLIFK